MVIKILFTVILYAMGLRMIEKSCEDKYFSIIDILFVVIYLVAITVGTILYTF